MTATPTTPTAHTGWTITSQVQGQQLVGTAFVQGVTVSFTTTAGNQGSVFVPLAGYTIDTVSAAVSARAAQLDAISNLTAQPSR